MTLNGLNGREALQFYDWVAENYWRHLNLPLFAILASLLSGIVDKHDNVLDQLDYVWLASRTWFWIAKKMKDDDTTVLMAVILNCSKFLFQFKRDRNWKKINKSAMMFSNMATEHQSKDFTVFIPRTNPLTSRPSSVESNGCIPQGKSFI